MTDLKRATLTPLRPRRQKGWRSFVGRHKLLLVTLLVLVAAVFFWTKFSQSSALNYVFGSQSLEQGPEGRVNVLLLGIGGGNHDGANLTDTIILAGYDPQTHRVDLISLPRDLWIDKYQTKVNALYQTGIDKNPNQFKFVEDQMGDILGTTIPYTVLVDFDGFTKAVDLVGGIDVNVQNTFDDYNYPVTGKEDDLCGYKEEQIDVSADQSKQLNIPTGKQKVYLAPDGKIATDSSQLDFSCRYEHIHFDKGLMHMDGTTALKYVRSRHGNNGEGSDFARSARQQLVIEAFRNKVLSAGTLLDPTKIVSLLQTFGDSISTDIPQSKYLSFITAFKQVGNVTSHVIDLDTKDQLLVHPDPLNYGGAWVLIPPNNDFSGVHKYVDDIFAGLPPATPSATPAVSASPKK